MSPIVKRYCVCGFLFTGIILYILYTQYGERELSYAVHSGKFIEIGFTSRDDDENEGVAVDKVLVNLTNFEFKITPSACQNGSREEVLGSFKKITKLTVSLFIIRCFCDCAAIIIVTTYIGHDEVRSAHRSAISQSILKELGLFRVFLLAEIPAHEKFITQQAIQDESKHFNDIVQGEFIDPECNLIKFVGIIIMTHSLLFAGNFIEAYRNLTYKHIMGLKWASSQNCHNPKFIIKMDDDIVVDFYHLSNYLRNISASVSRKENYLAGYVLREVRPIRLRQNKWFVSYEEYEGDLYPDYLSGWMYVTIPTTARRLVHASSAKSMKFFWIDDTWVTGVLREHAKIDIDESWNELFSANSQFLDCCVNDMKGKRYRCPFIAGPNGGDHRLIATFLQTNHKQCYVGEDRRFVPSKNNCPERPVSITSLKKACVGVDKHLLVESHGAAIISAIKL